MMLSTSAILSVSLCYLSSCIKNVHLQFGFWKGLKSTMSKFNDLTPRRRAYFDLLFELWKENGFALLDEDGDAISLDTNTIMSIICQLTNVCFEQRSAKGCWQWEGARFPGRERPGVRWRIGVRLLSDKTGIVFICLLVARENRVAVVCWPLARSFSSCTASI